jgi:hypothetical protein
MSWCMRKIQRQRRPLLGVTGRWVILGTAFACTGYILHRVAGPHPGFWGAGAAGAAAFVFVDCVGRTVHAVKRTRGAAPADRRNEACHEVLPVPVPEVLALLGQGREIQAIKRYRELNPGVSLKEAKDVIDGLVGRVLSGGGTADPEGTR